MLLLLSFPGTALAGHGSPPPGNSGTSQYLESLPGPGGNHSDPGGGGSVPGGGTVLSPSAQQALAAQGPAGERAAALASRTAPREARAHRKRRGENGGAAGGGRNGKGGHGGSGSSIAAEDNGGSGFVSAVERAAGGGDSGGMGAALPIILGLGLAAALLIAIRRRGTGGDSAGSEQTR